MKHVQDRLTLPRWPQPTTAKVNKSAESVETSFPGMLRGGEELLARMDRRHRPFILSYARRCTVLGSNWYHGLPTNADSMVGWPHGTGCCETER